MDAVVIDVDGTLSNLDHRLHHIRKEPRDYDSFYAAMGEDEPVHDILWLVDLLVTAQYEQGDFVFFICTGRPEDYRELTETWLEIHVPRLHSVAHTLYMRPPKDHRPDTVIKDEMRQYIEELGFNIRFVLDDRSSVVANWRESGITCLQVNQWDET
jgi:hypothetical protein